MGAPDEQEIEEPGKREQSKLERRSRIVRAARDLIRETGDTSLSMRMIAHRAKVSLATPYNLFGSKHAVVLAVFEDERDFVARFSKLKAATALERIFDAHALAMSYFIDDPDFYRPLWKALLDTQGSDSTGLATPARLERNRAGWRALIEDAQVEGLLEQTILSDMLERTLTTMANGAMLAWAIGMLPTRDLLPTAALGYALVLRGAATHSGARSLESRIDLYQAMLKKPESGERTHARRRDAS